MEEWPEWEVKARHPESGMKLGSVVVKGKNNIDAMRAGWPIIRQSALAEGMDVAFEGEPLLTAEPLFPKDVTPREEADGPKGD